MSKPPPRRSPPVREVHVPCPKCKKRFKFPLAKIIPDTSTTCPSCGAPIRFTRDDGRVANAAIDELKRAFHEKFGKR